MWAGHKGRAAAVPDRWGGNEYNLSEGSDFLAVVDADGRSATYGKVLRTVSVATPPGVGHEAHHVQPFVPQGCSSLLANGLFTDSWFTFDLSDPLRPRLTGLVTDGQTAGSLPAFAAVLPNCEALGSETGGPLLGPHGTLIRLDARGAAVLEEAPASRIPTDLACTTQWDPVAAPTKPGGPFTRKTDAGDCLPASPLGLSVRTDLNTVVSSDYADAARLALPLPATADAGRFTVRHYDLDPACATVTPPPRTTRCIGAPRVVILPDGPREEINEAHEENVAVEGLAATHAPGHLNPTGKTPDGHLPSRGAFAATSCGGALYYTPDMTARHPRWQEVFDFSAAGEAAQPNSRVPASCVGGGGLLVTPDNRYVIASIIGREAGQTRAPIGRATDPRPFPGMIVMLDVHQLVRAGAMFSCAIDHPDEVWSGGAEPDCPRIASVHVVDDPTSGGPHDLALDYANGGRRLAYFTYFVSETGIGGDLRACVLRLADGRLIRDRRFPADVDGQEAGSGCISFDRADWPGDRGPGAGPAKPHHGMFHNAR
ncbi:MAG TPA: hypothetical protein VM324_05080 [Egibacteraceae bacterium]|nr:hypothetical protein [Egibacteraceae bacterium]